MTVKQKENANYYRTSIPPLLYLICYAFLRMANSTSLSKNRYPFIEAFTAFNTAIGSSALVMGRPITK